jgi:(1->4)-alpha-D-glucan 1-alpha-D-glucosylmutase
VPTSTYRLQLTPEFGFADVAGIAYYLASLGVTHAYLSPILQSVPDSTHGYDVVDHSRIRAEFGGEDGFRAMAATLREHGIGIVVDIVPNHMALAAPEHLNRQLWSVLRDGRDSPYAHWFDVDWARNEGRMLLPILAGPPEQCLDDLAVDPDGPDGAPVLRYYDHVLPLWPGTARLPLVGLLETQHYKLADWRDAATFLNWRRFFDIASLIAVRVEDPGVFRATHEVITRLAAEGLIDGLRVDHPDGLADPRGYFRQLAEATGGMWVVAEKILERGERLPADWPVAGTTGYDTLSLVGGLFHDQAGAAPLTAQYDRFVRARGRRPPTPRFATVAALAKREATIALGSEVNRLARLLPGGPASEDVQLVLTELLAAFPVYRAYTYPGEVPSPEAEAAMAVSLAAARELLPGRLHQAAADVSATVLNATDEALSTRFQQTTGPVLAKGVEDTAFYRWPRLVSGNEVGCDPDYLGITPAEFHENATRLNRDWPLSMTTLSTHDTKRQEDVRARLAVLTEIPGRWGETVANWHARIAMAGGGEGGKDVVVDPDTEYFLWQTFVGAWPLSGYRLTGYLLKAIREAKLHTSWTDPDPDYEAAVMALSARILADGNLVRDIRAFIDEIWPYAIVASMGAKLVQLTMPGVADTYQGCELGGLALVDPDNRHTVNFAHRQRMLHALDEGQTDPALRGRKLQVTANALRVRRDHPDWFTGPAASYLPLVAEGPAADHVVAFGRGGSAGAGPGSVTVATRLPVGLERRGGWADTSLPLPGPEATWRDVLTGRPHRGGGFPLAELTSHFPVALLVREGRS